MAFYQIHSVAGGFSHAAVFWFMFGCSTALGAIIGSFLNVVIHRLPRGESVAFPNSRCPNCEAAIRPYDNVPVLSYLFLRGRCRACGEPISRRYPAVEVLTAFLFAAVFLHAALRPAALLLDLTFIASLVFDFVFVSTLVALVFIDAEHWYLPDKITLPGIAFALVARALVLNLYGVGFLAEGALAGWPPWALSLVGALLGALVGGGFLWVVGWIWLMMRKIDAMGLGDVKMMFLVGAYLGWPLTVVTLFLAVLIGSLAGISVMIYRRELDMKMLIPFGVFLGVGAVVSLLLGSAIVEWYVGKF